MKPSIALLGGLLFGTIGAVCAIFAVRYVLRGEYLSAVVVVGVSMFCFGLVVPLAKALPGNIKPRINVNDRGTTIRPDRGIDIPIQLSLLGLVIAGGLFVIFAPTGRLDIPVPREMRLYLPFVAAIAALSGAPVLWRSLRRGSSKYLCLTPDGFEIAQGWRPHAADWATVRDVTDVIPGQSVPTRGAIVVITSDGAASLAAASITPDGRALRELVRYYWINPDRRDELTDGRAIQRLADYQA
jgi:hypothetical protein